MSRFHRPARRRDRHRLVEHPGGACDCRAGKAPDRVPAHREFFHSAHNGPLSAGSATSSRTIIRKSAASPAKSRATASTSRPTAARSTTTMSAAQMRPAGSMAAWCSWPPTTTSCSTRSQRHRRRFCADQDRRDRQGPRDGKAAAANSHPIGTKRICVDTDYFAAFNKPNVEPGRYQGQSDRGDHRERRPRRRQGYEADAGAGDGI